MRKSIRCKQRQIVKQTITFSYAYLGLYDVTQPKKTAFKAFLNKPNYIIVPTTYPFAAAENACFIKACISEPHNAYICMLPFKALSFYCRLLNGFSNFLTQ